jgi:predicted house-cleaning noncanonical NTP pyrophosphatase (MazG superfamily)
MMEKQSPENRYPETAVYKKLVRDKIVEIIEADGLVAETRELSQEEVIQELKTKAIEESCELGKAEDIAEVKKEISDVLEVLRSLCEELGISMSEIEALMEKRAEARGRFKNRTYLIRTYKDEQ